MTAWTSPRLQEVSSAALSWASSLLVLLDDKVEVDATPADAGRASFVHPKRRMLGVEGKRPGWSSAAFVARFLPLPGYSFAYDLMSLLRART